MIKQLYFFRNRTNIILQTTQDNFFNSIYLPEVKSRTQGSRSRTQKNPRPKQRNAFRGQTLSRGMLEVKDQGHRAQVFQKETSSGKGIANFPHNFGVFQKKRICRHRGEGQGLQNVSSRSMTSSRTPSLVFTRTCGACYGMKSNLFPCEFEADSLPMRHQQLPFDI